MVRYIYQNHFIERKICPGCKSENIHDIYSCNFLDSPIKNYLKTFYSSIGKIEFEFLIGSQYIVDECRDCSLVFQKQVPDEFLAGKIYEEWIEPYQHLERTRTVYEDLNVFSWNFHEIIMIIKYFKKGPYNLNFLDFGMGWGTWCRMATALNCNVIGTELSKTRADYARSMGVTVITQEDIPKYSFDFIHTEQVFEHLSEPLEVLLYLKNSLKSDGIIKISVPNGKNIKKRLDKFNWDVHFASNDVLNSIIPLQHINCFNRESLFKMAEIAGFEVVKIPLKIQLSSNLLYGSFNRIFRNLLRPIYSDVFSKGTYIFLKKIKDPSKISRNRKNTQ